MTMSKRLKMDGDLTEANKESKLSGKDFFFQFHNFEKFRNLAEIAVNLTIGFRGLPSADTDAD